MSKDRLTERLAFEGDAEYLERTGRDLIERMVDWLAHHDVLRLPERLPQAYVRFDGGVRIPARVLAHLNLAEGGGVAFMPVEGQPGEVLLLSNARALERLGTIEEEE